MVFPKKKKINRKIRLNIDIQTLIRYYHQLVSYKRLIGYTPPKERK